MEPAVRSPRTESAIITDRAQNGGFGLPRLPYSRLPKGIGRGNPGVGNGIFGCRDGRLKIGLRDRKYHQRPKERNDTGENPRRNGLFGADPEICGLEGLDGGRDGERIWDPEAGHTLRAGEPNDRRLHASAPSGGISARLFPPLDTAPLIRAPKG